MIIVIFCFVHYTSIMILFLLKLAIFKMDISVKSLLTKEHGSRAVFLVALRKLQFRNGASLL